MRFSGELQPGKKIKLGVFLPPRQKHRILHQAKQFVGDRSFLHPKSKFGFSNQHAGFADKNADLRQPLGDHLVRDTGKKGILRPP